jgi:hypothetical protein
MRRANTSSLRKAQLAQLVDHSDGLLARCHNVLTGVDRGCYMVPLIMMANDMVTAAGLSTT